MHFAAGDLHREELLRSPVNFCGCIRRLGGSPSSGASLNRSDSAPARGPRLRGGTRSRRAEMGRLIRGQRKAHNNNVPAGGEGSGTHSGSSSPVPKQPPSRSSPDPPAPTPHPPVGRCKKSCSPHHHPTSSSLTPTQGLSHCCFHDSANAETAGLRCPAR